MIITSYPTYLTLEAAQANAMKLNNGNVQNLPTDLDAVAEQAQSHETINAAMPHAKPQPPKAKPTAKQSPTNSAMAQIGQHFAYTCCNDNVWRVAIEILAIVMPS